MIINSVAVNIYLIDYVRIISSLIFCGILCVFDGGREELTTIVVVVPVPLWLAQ